MYELIVPIPAFNADLLHQQLTAAVGADYLAISTYGQGKPISVFLVDAYTPADVSTAQATCAAHDPSQKTAAQTAAAQVSATTATLLSKLKNEVAYFSAVPAPDLTSGVAVQRLCTDFAALLTALSTRLN